MTKNKILNAFLNLNKIIIYKMQTKKMQIPFKTNFIWILFLNDILVFLIA